MYFLTSPAFRLRPYILTIHLWGQMGAQLWKLSCASPWTQLVVVLVICSEGVKGWCHLGVVRFIVVYAAGFEIHGIRDGCCSRISSSAFWGCECVERLRLFQVLLLIFWCLVWHLARIVDVVSAFPVAHCAALWHNRIQALLTLFNINHLTQRRAQILEHHIGLFIEFNQNGLQLLRVSFHHLLWSELQALILLAIEYEHILSKFLRNLLNLRQIDICTLKMLIYHLLIW